MSPTEFVKIVESRLGFVIPPVDPHWETYRQEASKVKRKIATNPQLYTWDNLLLAVEYLAQKGMSRNPVGVFSFVESALAVAKEPEQDVELDIRAAIRVELHRGDPDGWLPRFSRAVGGYRREALEEWRATQ